MYSKHNSIRHTWFGTYILACMRQLMCTAVSQLSSDQLVPLHHHAHFIYPACLFFLIYKWMCGSPCQ